MSASDKQSRRTFIKKSLTILSAVPVAAAIQGDGFIRPAYAEAGVALSPDHPQAKALGYMHDATKVDVAKFPKRAGADGAKQSCANCQLLTQKGLTAVGQDGDWGKCALFPTGLVNTKGWCNSWVMKAGA